MRFAGRRREGRAASGTFVAGVLQPMRSMDASPEVDRDAGRTPELNIVLNLCTVGLHMLHMVGAWFLPLLFTWLRAPPTVSSLQT